MVSQEDRVKREEWLKIHGAMLARQRRKLLIAWPAVGTFACIVLIFAVWSGKPRPFTCTFQAFALGFSIYKWRQVYRLSR